MHLMWATKLGVIRIYFGRKNKSVYFEVTLWIHAFAQSAYVTWDERHITFPKDTLYCTLPVFKLSNIASSVYILYYKDGKLNRYIME